MKVSQTEHWIVRVTSKTSALLSCVIITGTRCGF